MGPSLELLGYAPSYDDALAALGEQDVYPARVTAVHKGGLEVASPRGHEKARLMGALKQAFRRAPTDRPAVGDWVAVRPQAGRPGIVAVLPRKSAFVRQKAGRRTVPQVIVANVDTVFAVLGLDGDFNPRRIERYLATIWESGAAPVVLLNKVDLVEDPAPYLAALAEVAPEVPVIVTAAKAKARPATAAEASLAAIRPYLAPGRAIALVGSSGVGKSTLANALVGAERQATKDLGKDKRGQHTTTHRELLPIPGPDGAPFGGGMLVDNPGMRELHLWDVDEGLSELFTDVEGLAEACRFRDCQHVAEPGCAVQAAIEEGRLTEARLRSFRKLRAEQAAQADRIQAREQRGRRGLKPSS